MTRFVTRGARPERLDRDDVAAFKLERWTPRESVSEPRLPGESDSGSFRLKSYGYTSPLDMAVGFLGLGLGCWFFMSSATAFILDSLRGMAGVVAAVVATMSVIALPPIAWLTWLRRRRARVAELRARRFDEGITLTVADDAFTLSTDTAGVPPFSVPLREVHGFELDRQLQLLRRDGTRVPILALPSVREGRELVASLNEALARARADASGYRGESQTENDDEHAPQRAERRRH